MATRYQVCAAAELPPGGRKIIQAGKKSIGVFNVAGEYHALLNLCPHQFAPLCLGNICGYSPPSEVGEFRYEREGEIIRCPWHGWEFDIKTGRSIFNPHKVRTASYPVSVAAGVESCENGCGGEKEASVETFPVAVEDKFVYVEV
jgi:3-phenylpropionate/trans-cinnamate dioxygenase ferredoxin subunit